MRTMRRKAAHQRRPGFEAMALDVGLADMIEHEAQMRKVDDGFQRRGQLRRLDDEIIDEAGLIQRREAAPDILAQQPVRIGFVLDEMANAHQPFAIAGRP